MIPQAVFSPPADPVSGCRLCSLTEKENGKRKRGGKLKHQMPKKKGKKLKREEYDAKTQHSYPNKSVKHMS